MFTKVQIRTDSIGLQLPLRVAFYAVDGNMIIGIIQYVSRDPLNDTHPPKYCL